VLSWFVTLGHKTVRIAPRSFSPPCSLALATNFAHSSLHVFRNLRTLSISVSHLSPIPLMNCALFHKKPGVHPLLLPLSPCFPGTPFSQMATPSALLSPTEPPRGIANTPSLSPFPRSLTQKQGGRGSWADQHSSPLARLSSLRSGLCALCVSAVSLLFFPFVPFAHSPCPSQHFPLQWGYPFPVITGENQ